MASLYGVTSASNVEKCGLLAGSPSSKSWEWNCSRYSSRVWALFISLNNGLIEAALKDEIVVVIREKLRGEDVDIEKEMDAFL